MISLGSLKNAKPPKTCEYLKMSFACTSATRLRAMALRFETYKIDLNSTMIEHLKKMSQMIRDLKSVGNNLSDEQEILVVLR